MFFLTHINGLVKEITESLRMVYKDVWAIEGGTKRLGKRETIILIIRQGQI